MSGHDGHMSLTHHLGVSQWRRLLLNSIVPIRRKKIVVKKGWYRRDSQEVYTWAFLGSELISPNLVCVYVFMYVCIYVRHAQKIAKLFFSVRSTQFPFKLNIIFKKKYINLLGPKILRSSTTYYYCSCKWSHYIRTDPNNWLELLWFLFISAAMLES